MAALDLAQGGAIPQEDAEMTLPEYASLLKRLKHGHMNSGVGPLDCREAAEVIEKLVDANQDHITELQSNLADAVDRLAAEREKLEFAEANLRKSNELAIERARQLKDERERCAKIAEDFGQYATAQQIAERIRAVVGDQQQC